MKIPKGYEIHHKDCNHENNDKTNLVLLPRAAHKLIHRWFGNILINALHTGKITREEFYKCCNETAKKFYENIIDLDVTKQVVVKQGELQESPTTGDNLQLSVYRNIYESSTTNSRVLPSYVEDSNGNTSALPGDTSDDIV